METTLTTVLSVSNAGAVPIGMHEGQSCEGYINAFGLLKKHFPLCFGGNKVSHYFIQHILSLIC